MSSCGNTYSGWAAYLSFFRHVSGLNLSVYEKWSHYETATRLGGFRFVHRRFWIVSDFPTTIGRDEQNRAHCDNGPQLAWPDGWKSYSIHGVRAPGWIVEHPEQITVSAIDAEQNAEVRRVMIERYGVARYVADSEYDVVDRDIDSIGQPRRLLLKRPRPNSEDNPILVVELQNSTLEPDGSRKTYHLRVHPELRPLLDNGSLGEPQPHTCLAAVASTFGMTAGEYQLSFES